MEICQIVVAIFKSVPTAQHGSRAMLPDWLKYEKRIRWYNLGKKQILLYMCVLEDKVCAQGVCLLDCLCPVQVYIPTILTGSLIIWEATSFTPIPRSEQREHYMHEQVCRLAGVRLSD